MRIGMILDKGFPPDPRVENEALAAISRGHEVFLFAFSNGDKPQTQTVNGIQVHYFPLDRFTFKSSALAAEFSVYSKRVAPSIRKFINQVQPDIVHVHDIRISEAVVRAGWKGKTVLDLHDNLPDIMRFYPHVNRFPGKLLINPKKWRLLEAKAIAFSDLILGVSPEFIDYYKKLYPEQASKFALLPNTISRSFYSHAEIDSNIIASFKNNKVLLYVGDTGLRRGLLTAIEAMPYIVQKMSLVKLVIIGSSKEDDILKNRVDELDLNDFVVFEGWQNVAKFPSYIKCASLGLSPLLSNDQHEVAYANKIFQYFGMKRAVLASDVKAQANLVTEIDAGWIHKAGDPVSFAEQALLALEHDDLRKAKAERGFDFVDHSFCWEEQAKNLDRYYQDL